MLSFLYTPHSSYIFNYYKIGRFISYEDFKKDRTWQDLIFNKEGAQGTVQVFKDTRNDSLSLATGGKIEGSAARIGGQIQGGGSADWANQLLSAYMPLEARKGARSFLNIGLGTGTTLRAAMSDAGLQEIDCVEINPIVMEAVKGYFYPELFEDQRIRFMVADARNYLSLIPKQYDIISSEPSYPVDQGISNLFSLEFFELVKSRLTEGGVFSQWLPGYLLSEEDKKMMIRTFRKAFLYVYAWHITSSDDIILLGSGSPVAAAYDIFKGMQHREKAEEIWKDYRLWLKPEDVNILADEAGVINSDDRPVLEFNAAKNMLGGRQQQEELHIMKGF